MAVMADKAELMEIVEQKELTIGQLSGETETIGSHTAVQLRQVTSSPPHTYQGSTSCYIRGRGRPSGKSLKRKTISFNILYLRRHQFR